MSGVIDRLSARVFGPGEHDFVASDRSVLRTPGSSSAATLAALPVGAEAVLGGFSGDLRPEVARRLFDLGFVPGAEVRVMRRAPLRDPVIYRVGGIEVALRGTEAGGVLVRVEQDEVEQPDNDHSDHKQSDNEPDEDERPSVDEVVSAQDWESADTRLSRGEGPRLNTLAARAS